MADRITLNRKLPEAERADFADDSICICIPIPPEIEGVPDIEGNGEPHVTVIYVGPGTIEDAHRLCDIIDAEREALAGEQLALGDLDHFDIGEQLVAHARVLVSPAVAHARERLVQSIEVAGFEPKHHPGPWQPHATLEYLEPGCAYTGEVPAGSWVCAGAEVWRGPERFVNGARGDKLARSGDKWLVLSTAGDQLGEFETEAEARERLRQIEAAKAATGDDERDDERADGASRSPAVITTPKTMVEILRVDAVELVEVIEPLPGPSSHPDGWVEYSVTYSQAGNVQVYGNVREYRPRSEVFAQASMDSGRGNPWELRHSKELLSPLTVLGVARGCMRTFEKHPDGNHTWGRAKAWDGGLIDAVTPSDDGLEPAFAPQVSLAYRILADRRHGTSDDGDPFDQIATGFIINSLAAEPKGKGGPSVRVHLDSVDRADVVTRADAMLELAIGVPSGTVYWDPASWERYDGGQRESKKDENTTMMKLFQKMLEARGLTGADAAAQLGIEASEFEAFLADPDKLTDEMVEKLAAMLVAAPQEDAGEGGDPDKRKLLEEIARMMGDPKMDRDTRDAKARALFDQMVPPGDGKPPKADPAAADPKREDGDGVDVEIDGESISVPAAAAAEIKKLREQGSGDGARADAAEKKLADSDMIPRKDADAMVLEQGMAVGTVMSLARASYGQEFEPEAGQLGALENLRPQPRKDKDKDGAEVELPVIIREDWELAALKGALGDTQGSAEFERIANASAAARPELMAMRLDDASKVVASRGHKGEEMENSIARMRAAEAEAKGEDRDRADADADPIADAIVEQHKVAGATRRAAT